MATQSTIFSPELAARFDKLVTLYPLRRSALIPMLLYAQDEIGYISAGSDRRGRCAHRHPGKRRPQRAQLLLLAAHQASRQIQRPGLHQHLLHAARRQRALRALQASVSASATRESRPTASSLSKRSSASEPAAGHPPSRSTTTFTRTSRRSRWIRSSTSIGRKRANNGLPHHPSR